MATKDENHRDATAAELVSTADVGGVGAAVETEVGGGEAVGGVSSIGGVVIAGHEY